MKPEIVLRNYLMSWLRPEYESPFRPKPGPAISSSGFFEMIKLFIDHDGDPIFDEKEAKTLEPLITNPLKFSTGYPRNVRDAIKLGTVYIVEVGWQETGGEIGPRFITGRGISSIVVSGHTRGENLNMAEPGLLIEMIASLLISGKNKLSVNHLKDSKVTITNYAQDERNSFEKQFALRSLTISYESKKSGVVTHDIQKEKEHQKGQ